ncbi:MAG: transposase [Firmicutes bacterium]|nr:transposase [Bacillota bacterium]
MNVNGIHIICPVCGEIDKSLVEIYNIKLRKQDFAMSPILPTCKQCTSEIEINNSPKWAIENLNEEMFQPLFSYYGRASVSPVYTFTAMLIQLEKGYSDREMEEETRFDDRVKYGITAPRDFDGIDAVTLCDHRKRFFMSDIGRKILLTTINQAKEAGIFEKV